MPPRIKIFVYAVIAVVAATVIAGFFAVGSPQNKRLQNFDDQRIQNLQFLQDQIINYWQIKQVLPANLASLNDATRGVSVPKDPQTGTDYEYILGKQMGDAFTRDPLSFTLCANFSLSSNASAPQPQFAVPAGPYGTGMANWEHGAGRTCFDRTIDKDFYKPINPAPVPVKQ